MDNTEILMGIHGYTLRHPNLACWKIHHLWMIFLARNMFDCRSVSHYSTQVWDVVDLVGGSFFAFLG